MFVLVLITEQWTLVWFGNTGVNTCLSKPFRVQCDLKWYFNVKLVFIYTKNTWHKIRV